MRVLQIIDSLEAGGAERMAVQIANALFGTASFSGLCVTRKEGLLKATISDDVAYVFVNKKKALDPKALKKARTFCKTHNIQIIHAHSTSYFFAVQLKIVLPHLKLVWHNHFGNSMDLDKRKATMLRWSSHYFNAIIAVNQLLEAWAKETLHCEKVCFIKNFSQISEESKATVKEVVAPELKGIKNKRIVCLANLRYVKNHILLLESFNQLVSDFPEWTLHFLGSYTEEDPYFVNLKTYIVQHGLEGKVFFYGSVQEVHFLLKQSTIGVLSSKGEGLPLALIEYGLAGLPVITTNVGQCQEVVGQFGLVVPSGSKVDLVGALRIYITDDAKRIKDAQLFQQHIKQNYSSKNALNSITAIYEDIQTEAL